MSTRGLLGRSANGITWMFRYLERAESLARLLDAGHRIALTRSDDDADEWRSVVQTVGGIDAFEARFGREFTSVNVAEFLLRDRTNPNSALAAVTAARENARMVRPVLTSEVWEAVNDYHADLRRLLARPVRQRDVVTVVRAILTHATQVRGAVYGSMLRSESLDFALAGAGVERADSTARILDVKYYVLLPSVALVGSSFDNVQWGTILRSLSAHRSYHWLHPGETRAGLIASFLIHDQRFPRSLAFACRMIVDALHGLATLHGARHPCHELAEHARDVTTTDLTEIFESGLHEFLQEFIALVGTVARQIEIDYRFHA